MDIPLSGFGGFGNTDSSTNNNAAHTTPDEKEIDDSTPWVAASDGDLNLLQKSLIALNLPYTCADSNGLTPIHSAASYGHIEIVRWIIRQDAEVGGGSEGSEKGMNRSVNARDNDGDTPLHHCDEVTAARVLVEEGNADYTLKNDQGETALEMKEKELAEITTDDGSDDSDDDTQNLVKLVKYLRGLANGDNVQGGEVIMAG